MLARPGSVTPTVQHCADSLSRVPNTIVAMPLSHPALKRLPYGRSPYIGIRMSQATRHVPASLHRYTPIRIGVPRIVLHGLIVVAWGWFGIACIRERIPIRPPDCDCRSLALILGTCAGCLTPSPSDSPVFSHHFFRRTAVALHQDHPTQPDRRSGFAALLGLGLPVTFLVEDRCQDEQQSSAT